MTIVLIAAVLYLMAAGLLVRQSLQDRPDRSWRFPAAMAVLLHAGFHVWLGPNDLHFFAALSLVGLGMAVFTGLFGARGKMTALGVVVFPLAAVLLVVYQVYGHQPMPPLGWQLLLHAWLALLAFATLSIAALLALMLWAQEHALRQHQLRAWLRALPPLTELETLLFRTITAGFVLLTATLLTGGLFVEDLLDQHLAHKTVFSLLSWLAFGALLLGRWLRGWRGRKAVRWTLFAMLLLFLAFFGSKFVLELVLQRGG